MKIIYLPIFISLLLFLSCKNSSENNDQNTQDETKNELTVLDSVVTKTIDSLIVKEKIEETQITETIKVNQIKETPTNIENKKQVETKKPVETKPTKLVDTNIKQEIPIKNQIKVELLSNEPLLVFKEKEHAFETVEEGNDIKFNFEFQNLGKKPLIISNARSACSCTFAEFPLEPILPGQSGKIKALFTTKGFYGKQVKTINVTSNAENSLEQLKIIGIVIEVEAFTKEREEKTKQWEMEKKEMEKQQAEMLKQLKEQKRKEAIADSIKRWQDKTDSTNTDGD